MHTHTTQQREPAVSKWARERERARNAAAATCGLYYVCVLLLCACAGCAAFCHLPITWLPLPLSLSLSAALADWLEREFLLEKPLPNGKFYLAHRGAETHTYSTHAHIPHMHTFHCCFWRLLIINNCDCDGGSAACLPTAYHSWRRDDADAVADVDARKQLTTVFSIVYLFIDWNKSAAVAARSAAVAAAAAATRQKSAR